MRRSTSRSIRGQQVIDAVDALFYARGIRAVGIDDVRAESGVSLKRLYSLFPGKDNVVLAVLRKRHAMWANGLTAAMGAKDDPRDAARRLRVPGAVVAKDSFCGCEDWVLDRNRPSTNDERHLGEQLAAGSGRPVDTDYESVAMVSEDPPRVSKRVVQTIRS